MRREEPTNEMSMIHITFVEFEWSVAETLLWCSANDPNNWQEIAGPRGSSRNYHARGRLLPLNGEAISPSQATGPSLASTALGVNDLKRLHGRPLLRAAFSVDFPQTSQRYSLIRSED